jgi:phospholipase C
MSDTESLEDARRRDFLRRSSIAIAALSGAVLFPSIRRALEIAPVVDSGTIQDVKHVVILMQENRSFDHYFGTLRGVRGFGDRFPIPLEGGRTVWQQSNGTRQLGPFCMDGETMNACFAPSTPHTFSDAQAAWNQGKLDHWPKFKLDTSMGYYQRDDLPFQYALADAFTICDAYHCSVTTGTDPNRIVFFSGSNFDPSMGKSGVNPTADDAEVNNFRCGVSGTMPSPGYAFTGSSFKWPTIPDLLQKAGVSWRIYQDPNENWSGLMHGCLAFESFREARPGSPNYENGLSHFSIADLARDVENGTLPSVSWILPSPAESEHPGGGGSTAQGADFIAQVLNALTSNRDVWSKTALFLTFDENDGMFDHMPPPAVPSFDGRGQLMGKSTVPLDGEYFSDPERHYLHPDDVTSGTVRPWGLGPRVPMYVISPWSRGGWVNSEVFDHTSVGRFLEKRFGIHIDAISPWHREVCGDLTSAFDFERADSARPVLPDTSGFAKLEASQRALPPVVAPTGRQPLFQEPGTRKSRALPYELDVGADLVDGQVNLVFRNTGARAAVFHVYDKKRLDLIPRRYTVGAGKTLGDVWTTDEHDGDYELWVYSVNGFTRMFGGNARTAERLHMTLECDPQGAIAMKLTTMGEKISNVVCSSMAYRKDGPWPLTIRPGETSALRWELGESSHWYDFSVAGPGFSRRFAGRIENGRPGVSDPAMGLG